MPTETEKEHDKLGPLAGPQLAPPSAEPAASPLRRDLVAAFAAAITAAQAASRLDDLDEAVHEVRKALRRARAAVHLVASALPRDDRRDLSRALVAARRQLSTVRDLAVAPGALAQLQLEAEQRAAAEAAVAQARVHAPTPEEVRDTLVAAVSAVEALPALLAASLPADADWDVVKDGLAATYRRARRQLRQARRSRTAFHAFRKRTKELTYQLELLAGGVDGHVESLRRGLADLGDEAGEVVDAIMLREVLDAGGDARPDGLDELLEAIDGHLAARIKATRKGARELFGRGARKWAKKVRKAARRDQAASEPPAPAPDGDDDVPAAKA